MAMVGLLNPERSAHPHEHSVKKIRVTDEGSFDRSTSITCLLFPFTEVSPECWTTPLYAVLLS